MMDGIQGILLFGRCKKVEKQIMEEMMNIVIGCVSMCLHHSFHGPWTGEKGDHQLISLGVPGLKIQVPTGGWEGIRTVTGPISGRISYLAPPDRSQVRRKGDDGEHKYNK
jgi:hypothetical protein